MRQKPGPRKSHGENVVKDISRATRKQSTAEEKIGIVLDGLKGGDSIANCAAAKVLRKACIAAGPRSSLKLGRSAWRVTQPAQRPRPKLKTCAENPVI